MTRMRHERRTTAWKSESMETDETTRNAPARVRTRGAILACGVVLLFLVAFSATAQLARQRIAFVSDPAGGAADIWSVQADGFGLTQLTTDVAADYYPRLVARRLEDRLRIGARR